MNDARLTPHEVVVWKKLMIGVVGSVEKYREAFKTAGIRVINAVSGIVAKTPVATEPQEVDLFLVTVAELGFNNLTRYNDICRRAKERGYALCPAEVALALRLAYTEQPMGEWLVIMTEDLMGRSVYDPHLFSVACLENGSWLEEDGSYPEGMWSPGSTLVFVRPKS